MKRIFTNTKADQQKLSVWLNYWLEVYAKPNTTSNTFRAYRISINKHLISELGEIRLCDINMNALQAFFNRKAEYSERYTQNIYAVLHIALQSAIELGIIKESNLDKVVLPKCKERDVRFLTLDEQHVLMNYIKSSDSLSLFGITLLLNLGLRKNEMRLLKWSNVDYDKMCIRLPDRVIPMTQSVYELLIGHKAKQRSAMQVKSLIQTNDTYIITTHKFVKYSPEGYNKTIRKVAAECSMPFLTATVLRNTFGVNSLMVNADIPTVSYVMGDSCVSVTKKRYAKLLEKLERE